MKPLDDRTLAAWMDGEIEDAERARLDAGLDPGDRLRLAGELRFEQALGASIWSGPGCPDAVWRDVSRRLRAPAGAPGLGRHRRWLGPLGAMAAVLAITLAVGAATRAARPPAFLTEIPRGRTIAVDVDTAHAEDFLRDHDLALDLSLPQTLSGHAGRAEMVGAREARYGSETVVELLYECCGKPLKVVVARQGTSAARAIERAAARGRVMDSRSVGNGVAAVVGNHRLPELLDLLKAVPSTVPVV